MNRPENTEYPERYNKYVQTVPEGNIVEIMSAQLKTVAALLNSIHEEKSYFRYAEGKWSIKEMVGHLNDVERILSYRALFAIRKDKTNLERMDQDKFVAAARFDDIPFDQLKKEFRFIRKATLMLFGNVKDESWLYTGFTGGQEFTVRAIAYIITGHANHHLNVLRERYL